MNESVNPLPERKKRGAPRGNKRAVGNGGGGRRPKYRAAMAGIARKACARGLTDFEVANLLGVSESTLHRWKALYPQFLRAFKAGKEGAHDRVERALFSRAVGYSFQAQKAVQTRYGPQILKWTEHCPPDVTAALSYLRNRSPHRWRDAIKHEHITSPYDHIQSASESAPCCKSRLVS